VKAAMTQKNGHAEIGPHDRREHLGLVGSLNRNGHGLEKDGGRVDAVAQRRRHEDRRDEQEKEPLKPCFPPECRPSRTCDQPLWAIGVCR
jgi:hypothetical protein